MLAVVAYICVFGTGFLASFLFMSFVESNYFPSKCKNCEKGVSIISFIGLHRYTLDFFGFNMMFYLMIAHVPIDGLATKIINLTQQKLDI